MHLNDNIAECLKIDRIRGQKFGIELEYENHEWRPNNDMALWMIDRDPSLRNEGVEFISPPSGPRDLPALFKDISTYMEAQPQLEANDRCGLHVHLNMTDSTWNQLFTISTLYTFLEPTIYAHHAQDRLDCHFCVPSFQNTALIEMLLEDCMALRNGKPHEPGGRRNFAEIADFHGIPRNHMEDIMVEDPQQYRAYERVMRARPLNPALRLIGASKYCALNYSRLKDLGTIEFRMHRASLDLGEVRSWVEWIGNLQKAAETFNDPLEVVAQYESGGLRSLLRLTGMAPIPVDKQHQEDAEDAATFTAGYCPPEWEDLSWEIDEAVAEVEPPVQQYRARILFDEGQQYM